MKKIWLMVVFIVFTGRIFSMEEEAIPKANQVKSADASRDPVKQSDDLPQSTYYPIEVTTEDIKKLIKNGDINTSDESSWSLLYSVVNAGRKDYLDLLIAAGMEVESQVGDQEESSPLHVAAAQGHVECLKTLLDAGADIEARNIYEETPLHLAAGKGHVECLKALLDKHADKETKTMYGYTPLYLAASAGQVECLMVLIKEGAEIEAKDNNEQTPLYIAAHKDHVECLKTLLEAGADKEVKNKGGMTPLHGAAGAGTIECLKVLLKEGAEIEAKNNNQWSTLHFAAANGHVECLKVLIKKGADVGAESNNESTPLHSAAEHDSAECLKTLLEAGAKIEAKNSDERTPLYLAAMLGKAECLKVLLEWGAEIEAKNKKGSTPLYTAAKHENVDCLKVLLKWGAEIEAKNKNEKTPFTIAKAKKSWKVLVALKEYQDSQEEAEDGKDGSLIIEGAEVQVPAQFFMVSETLKDASEDAKTIHKIPVPSATRAIWNLLEEKIDSFCAPSLMVEYLKSIDRDKFIESDYYKALKKEYIDHYAQYAKEQVGGLLNLCSYLNIPFLIDVFSDTYAKIDCTDLEGNVHKDYKATVLKAMITYFGDHIINELNKNTKKK